MHKQYTRSEAPRLRMGQESTGLELKLSSSMSSDHPPSSWPSTFSFPCTWLSMLGLSQQLSSSSSSWLSTSKLSRGLSFSSSPCSSLSELSRGLLPSSSSSWLLSPPLSRLLASPPGPPILMILKEISLVSVVYSEQATICNGYTGNITHSITARRTDATKDCRILRRIIRPCSVLPNHIKQFGVCVVPHAVITCLPPVMGERAIS